MPLDPQIILGGTPAPLESPLKAISAIAQMQDVQAQTETRRLAADKARQSAMDDAAMKRVLTATNGDVDAALPQLRMINPRAAATFEEQIGKARKETFDAMKSNLEVRGKKLDLGLKIGQSVNDDQSYQVAKPTLLALSPDLAQVLPETYDPARWQQVMQMGLSAKEIHDQKLESVKLFAEGKASEALNTALSVPGITPDQWNQTIQGALAIGVPKEIVAQVGEYSPANVAAAAQRAISPAKRAELAQQATTHADAQHSPAYKEWTDYQAQGGPLDFNAYMTMDANRKAVHMRINTGQATGDDLKEAIAGMKDGTLPPQLPGRGSAAYTGLMAEAHRQGFDLAAAATDWTAAQKHFATLNGTQQTRLRQAVDTAAHSLDVIDTLAGQWKGGKFPILNRANLALAKNGVYGPDVATTARALDAQIADVTSELANAYMGGNSPSDHALALAAKNLSSDWSEKTLKDMTALARTNLTIRQNAIKNVGAIGASEVNPYVPVAPPVAPPPGGSPTGGLTYQDYLRSRGGR